LKKNGCLGVVIPIEKQSTVQTHVAATMKNDLCSNSLCSTTVVILEQLRDDGKQP